MSKDKRLRETLEPETPRLRPEAADRLQLRVEEALRKRSTRRPWRLALPAAPALAALLLLLWFKPWSGGETPQYRLLDEEGYLNALTEYRDEGGSLNDVFDYDEETTDYASENWTDDDWLSFQEALEDFQLTDNGGA